MIYVPENQTHKIHWDFENSDLVLINKKKKTYLLDFAVPTNH